MSPTVADSSMHLIQVPLWGRYPPTAFLHRQDSNLRQNGVLHTGGLDSAPPGFKLWISSLEERGCTTSPRLCVKIFVLGRVGLPFGPCCRVPCLFARISFYSFEAHHAVYYISPQTAFTLMRWCGSDPDGQLPALRTFSPGYACSTPGFCPTGGSPAGGSCAVGPTIRAQHATILKCLCGVATHPQPSFKLH